MNEVKVEEKEIEMIVKKEEKVVNIMINMIVKKEKKNKKK